MASAIYGSSVQADNSRAACAEVKSLTVDRLKKVLRTENLPVSGVKNELQMRLIAHIERCASSGEYTKVDRIRDSLRGVTSFTNPYPSPYTANTPTSSLSPRYAPPVSRPPPPMPAYNTGSSYSPRVNFKPSPFYTIVKQLGPVYELKAREGTRDVKKVDVKLDLDALEQMRDPNVRIMVFCAAENYGRPLDPADITFPQHGDLKCNEAEVKHNLKGMKNKPGTTRPADITPYLRKSSSYPNSVELVYALTTKHAEQKSSALQKFFLVINMVRQKPLESLVSELRQKRTPFQKDRVIVEMRSRAEDPDLVATSTVMSLKDPLQMTRIQTPCRGISCTHYACFDATAFLALQEQAPTWSCPHCNKPVTWDNLAFDHYFDDILRNTSESDDQVTIEPDGRWHREAGASTQNGRDDDNSSDDDIVEITNTRATLPRLSTSSFHAPSVSDNTPRRDYSTPTPLTPSIPPSTNSRSNKRTHSDTIDLTLDDDDDDEGPVSSNKRPNVSSTTSNLSRPPPIPNEPYRFSIPPPAPNPYNSYRYPSGY